MDKIVLFPLPLEELREIISGCINDCLRSHSGREDEYISVADAQKILAVSRPTIYEYIKDKRLTKYKIGKATRLLRSEVLSIVIAVK